MAKGSADKPIAPPRNLGPGKPGAAASGSAAGGASGSTSGKAASGKPGPGKTAPGKSAPSTTGKAAPSASTTGKSTSDPAASGKSGNTGSDKSKPVLPPPPPEETPKSKEDSPGRAALAALKRNLAKDPASTPAAAPAVTTVKEVKPNAVPRKQRVARLRLVQIDAWSVMKTTFLLSIAIGIVQVVAVAIIWTVLGQAGVWDSINSIVQQSIGGEGAPFDIEKYLGPSRVIGFTLIAAVLDVILLTALATLAAFLYNLAAALLGGIEVTLAEDR